MSMSLPIARKATFASWLLPLTAIMLISGHMSAMIACLSEHGVIGVKPRDFTLALTVVTLGLVFASRPAFSPGALALLIIPALRFADSAVLKRYENVQVGDHSIAVMTLANVLLVTAVALLVLCTERGPKIIQWAAIVIIVLGSGSILYESAGYADYTNIKGRPAGFIGQPNEAIIMVCLMLGIVLTLNENFWLNALVIGIAAVGVAVTLSRSGMLIFVPLVLSYMTINLRKHFAKVAIIIGISIPLAIAGIAMLAESAASRNFGTDKNTKERIEAIFGGNTDKMESAERMKDLTDGWEAVGESPVFGHGTGCASSHWQPHNQWVAIWLDIGVLGVVLYAITLIGITARCVMAGGKGFLCLMPLWGFSVFSQNLVETAGYWLCAGVAIIVSSRSRVRFTLQPTPASQSGTSAIPYAIVALCLSGLASATAQDQSALDKPWIPALRTDTETYREIVAAEAKVARETHPEIVFIGDSLTKAWEEQDLWKTQFEPLHTVNFGLGGDGPQHVLWRMEHGIVDGIEPKAVVLMIGINNFWRHYSAEDTAKGIETIVQGLQNRLPRTRIVLLSVLPALQKISEIRPWIKTINNRIEKMQVSNKQVQFVDLYASFLGAGDELRAGCYMPDELHLAPGGYALLAHRLTPLLQALSQTAK